MAAAWPELAYQDWKDTCETLHRWTQIVGKIQLACTPKQNHWWNVGLHPTATGLRTMPMARPDGEGAFDIAFDLVDHALLIRLSDGRRHSMPLVPCSVATFHARLFSLLHDLGIELKIREQPSEIAVDAIPFDQDELHRSYDEEAVGRFFQVLSRTGLVLEEFTARFTGKVSPVLFWWGTFDLSVSRYTGREAPARKGADVIVKEAYSHELSSAGFWPGDPTYPQAAFFSYTAPAPDRYGELPVNPPEAFFDADRGLFLLPYEDVAASASPRRMLLDFFQSTYEAGADAGGWDRERLERHEPAPAGESAEEATVH